MAYGHTHHVSDEERRDFLKALGVAGAVSVSGVTLEEVRSSMSAGATEELAPIGQAINADLEGTIDAKLLANQQQELATAAGALTEVADRGLPMEEPRDEFAAIAVAGRPVYDHLKTIGFFESTSEHLPAFHPEFLDMAVETFVGSELLATPLKELGLTDGDGVDLLATVVANAEDLKDYNWVSTDAFSREKLEDVAAIPPVTMGAAGGALLWLEDLDDHLWRRQVLISDEILANAIWHGQSMAAGFHLMAKGAEAIGTKESEFSNSELTALLSTGIAVQEISQSLLPQDVYWITEEMRDSRRTDLETVTW